MKYDWQPLLIAAVAVALLVAAIIDFAAEPRRPAGNRFVQAAEPAADTLVESRQCIKHAGEWECVEVRP